MASKTNKKAEQKQKMVRVVAIVACCALLLTAVLQAATALLLPRLRKRKVGGLILPAGMTRQARPWLEALLLGLIVGSIITSWHNKREMVVMFSQPNIGGIEHELTRNDCAQFYQPIYRLAFSIFSNELASQQVEKLIEAKDRVRMLNTPKKKPPFSPGRRAAAKNPPQSRAVPQSAAQRGPFRSCRKPPMTHPTPKAAIKMPKAYPAPCSLRPYSSITGCWNTPHAAGRPVST